MKERRRMVLSVSTVGIEDELEVVHDMRIGYDADVVDLRVDGKPDIPSSLHRTGTSKWFYGLTSHTLDHIIYGNRCIIVLHNHWTWMHYETFFGWLVEMTDGRLVPIETSGPNPTVKYRHVPFWDVDIICKQWRGSGLC